MACWARTCQLPHFLCDAVISFEMLLVHKKLGLFPVLMISASNLMIAYRFNQVSAVLILRKFLWVFDSVLVAEVNYASGS